MKKEIVERYNKLSKKQQEEVLKKLMNIIKNYEDINLQKKLKEECILNGLEPFDILSEKIKNENVDDTIQILRKRINKEDI